MSRHLLFFVVLSLLFVSELTSQEWTQFTEGRYIDAIAEYQSERWVATDGGLVRMDFNGLPTFYNTANSILPSHFIYDLQVLSDNKLYIGTGEGLVIYDGIEFEHIYDLGKGEINGVTGIAEDSKGDIWLSVLGIGLLRKNSNAWDAYTAEAMQIPHNSIRELHIDDQDRIWLGYRDLGLAVFDPNTYTSVYYDENNSEVGTKEIRDITSLENGEVWVATIGGLHVFKDDEWTVYNASNTTEIRSDQMYSVIPGLDNEIWIGTNGGYLVYDGEWMSGGFFNQQEVSRVTCMLIDESARLWAGTNYGLYTRSNLSWRSYDTSLSEIPNNYIAAVRETNDGKVWLGAFEGSEGLYSLDGSSFTDHTPELPHALYNGIIELEVNDDGWIAAAAGFINDIHVYDGSEWISRTLDASVNDFEFDTDNNLWASTIRGIHKITDGQITIYDMGNTDMVSDRIYDLDFDKDGILYAASREGLISYDGNNWDQVNIDNTILDNGEINGVFFDNQDRLWVAHDGGISVREGNNWTNYDHNNSPIPEDQRTFRFIQDNQGAIWARLFKGLMKIEESDWTFYTTLNSGLTRNDASDISPARDGGIWIATSLGLVYHNGESTSLVEVPQDQLTVYTYPNPSLGEVHIRLEERATDLDISIIDSEGKTILSRQDLTDQEFKLTLPETKGVYWLQVRTNNGMATKKLIRQ